GWGAEYAGIVRRAVIEDGYVCERNIPGIAHDTAENKWCPWLRGVGRAEFGYRDRGNCAHRAGGAVGGAHRFRDAGLVGAARDDSIREGPAEIAAGRENSRVVDAFICAQPTSTVGREWITERGLIRK